jgi:mono/diheme cytochrome c family protein
MRDRWMSGLVAALSLVALVGSVLFAWSRGADTTLAQPSEPIAEAELAAAAEPMAEPTADDAPAEPTADKPSGRAVFEARCKRCHSLEETVDYIKKQPKDKREPYLTRLLGRHFPPPPEERPALVQYLLEATARTDK